MRRLLAGSVERQQMSLLPPVRGYPVQASTQARVKQNDSFCAPSSLQIAAGSRAKHLRSSAFYADLDEIIGAGKRNPAAIGRPEWSAGKRRGCKRLRSG